MKPFFLSAALLAGATCSSWARAPEEQALEPQPEPSRAAQFAPARIVRGEAFFLERIALPPGARLHAALLSRVEGTDYLPLATVVVAAKNGTTRFAMPLPEGPIPPGPYRLQAWIVAENRALFEGHDPRTVFGSLDQPLRIRLKIRSAPQPTPQNVTVRGQISKLDRRALRSDARIEVSLSDASGADAGASTLALQNIDLQGKQLPIDFALQVVPSDLKPNGQYTLSARVYEGGRLSYVTGALVDVSAQNLAQNFTLRLVAVR